MYPYSAALANGTPALIAGMSLAVRRPFTLGITKQSTPREFWDLPVFLQINMIITSVGTASFVLTAAALTLIAHAGGQLVAGLSRCTRATARRGPTGVTSVTLGAPPVAGPRRSPHRREPALLRDAQASP